MFWITLLRRFWPLIAGAALFLGAWIWHLGEIRSARQDERRAVVAEYQQALAEQREIDLRKHQENARAWNIEREALYKRSLSINPAPIRLCSNAPSLPPADPVASPDGASGGGRHAVQAEPDIAPELVSYGTECLVYQERLKQAQKDAGL